MYAVNNEENRLTFSANGSGVVLKTKYGFLHFSAEEYTYYQSLFKIADTNGIGKLIIDSTQLCSLLMRTNIIWNTVNKILQLVVKFRNTDEDDSSGLHFHQWLMLCKLIGYTQEYKKIPSEKLFRNLHSPSASAKIPFAKFYLDEAVITFENGKYFKQFIVQLSSWQICGDEFQNNQHVKFKLLTTSQLINESSIVPSSSSTLNQTSTSSCIERSIVERRYSEFESFSNILLKNYKGLLLPYYYFYSFCGAVFCINSIKLIYKLNNGSIMNYNHNITNLNNNN
jgi:hypothetical protein